MSQVNVTGQLFSRTNVTIEDTNGDHGGKRPQHIPEQKICVVDDAVNG